MAPEVNTSHRMQKLQKPLVWDAYQRRLLNDGLEEGSADSFDDSMTVNPRHHSQRFESRLVEDESDITSSSLPRDVSCWESCARWPCTPQSLPARLESRLNVFAPSTLQQGDLRLQVMIQGSGQHGMTNERVIQATCSSSEETLFSFNDSDAQLDDCSMNCSEVTSPAFFLERDSAPPSMGTELHDDGAVPHEARFFQEQRTTVFALLAQVARTLSMSLPDVYSAVLMMDLCRHEGKRVGRRMDCVQLEVLALSCLYLARERKASSTSSPEQFCLEANLMELGSVKGCMIQHQLAMIETFIPLARSSSLTTLHLCALLEERSGVSEMEHMADFVVTFNDAAASDQIVIEQLCVQGASMLMTNQSQLTPSQLDFFEKVLFESICPEALDQDVEMPHGLMPDDHSEDTFLRTACTREDPRSRVQKRSDKKIAACR